MKKHQSLRLVGLAMLSMLASAFASIAAAQDDGLQIGQRFEVIGGLYAYGIADNLNTRELSLISLNPLHLSGPEVVSKQPVPKASILTIVTREPKGFPAFLYTDRYKVSLTGLDAPAGIPIVIDLCCGVQGKTTPLNPTIFRPLP